MHTETFTGKMTLGLKWNPKNGGGVVEAKTKQHCHCNLNILERLSTARGGGEGGLPVLV